jgi:hypothetical protein
MKSIISPFPQYTLGCLAEIFELFVGIYFHNDKPWPYYFMLHCSCSWYHVDLFNHISDFSCDDIWFDQGDEWSMMTSLCALGGIFS